MALHYTASDLWREIDNVNERLKTDLMDKRAYKFVGGVLFVILPDGMMKRIGDGTARECRLVMYMDIFWGEGGIDEVSGGVSQ